MRIGVCDDVATTAEGWVEAIRMVADEKFVIARLETAKEEVSNLLRRKLAVENNENPLEIATEFDLIDILVIDYDLIHLDEDGSRTTGEGVARLARSFSTCGAIVLMNQYKGAQFDLGMRGHLESFADINIEASLVGKAALWKRVAPEAKEFNPTTWTPMPELLAAARDLADKLSQIGLNGLIMPLLGLEADALAGLSDSAFGFISQSAETGERLAATTLREFLASSLDPKILECLSREAPQFLYSLAAYRLLKWLDREVLRPMNVLVDAAHLLDRLPFMIDSEKLEANDPISWAKAVVSPWEFLRWDLLKNYYNGLASGVLGKPVFDWLPLADDESIYEMQDDYLAGEAKRYFLAEDTSRFVEKEGLMRFRADFHNFGDRRAIEQLDNVTYGPLRRISFG